MVEKNIPSLDGLIQSKGAPRPDAMPQRGEGPARTLQSDLVAKVTPPAASSQPIPLSREPRAKSLTLRLSETQYERLRKFAFESRLSHQDIIEQALMTHLDQQARGG
jgi:hypothetical protein